ncbi:hypothetical protein MRB53_002692 [Persea americana]|uniref:Uncharacterized protein n=1 Tax=Persea americana TaxID=3435 RepID=A0ACC2MVE0_PERAE|nr:hypothetical protein MRB53_002692 [Persea americana]
MGRHRAEVAGAGRGRGVPHPVPIVAFLSTPHHIEKKRREEVTAGFLRIQSPLTVIRGRIWKTMKQEIFILTLQLQPA